MKKIDITLIKPTDQLSISLNGHTNQYDIVIGEQKASLGREEAIELQKRFTDDAKVLVQKTEAIASIQNQMTTYLKRTTPLGIA